MKWIFILISFICSSLASCYPGSLVEEKLTDITYQPFAEGKMDVFLPANRDSKTPFVVLIHGGGWVAGDKSWMEDLQHQLLIKGIASANINYRYADATFHFQQILGDIDSALSFCENNFEKWGIHPAAFVLCGTSAGGHLALLGGYTLKRNIKAIIALCPITNFTDTSLLYTFRNTDLYKPVTFITGATYTTGDDLHDAYTKASPLHNASDIPTLLIHGTNDQTVPFSQSESMAEELNKKGYTHKLLTIPDAGHDLNIYKDPATGALIYGKIVSWVKKYSN